MEIYSVYDSVVGEYYSPLFCRNCGEAVRSFRAFMLRTPALQKDCKLFKLGVFDSATGVIVPCQPEFICYYVED